MNNFLRRTLIVVLVGGGFHGICSYWSSIVNPLNHNLFSALLLGLCLLIYTYHIYAGMALVDNEEKTTPALLALLLQVPIISSPVLFYKVSTGFAASAYFESPRLTGYWNIGSEYQVHLLPSFNFGIGINIFALILVILLLKARKGFKSTQGQAKELRAEPIA